MKLKGFKRILSVILALVIIALMPMPALASYEDGQECWLCGHYHWDEYMCGMCGACSIECTNATCCVTTHCNECGTCLAETVFCTECHHCEDCYLGEGWHCSKCQDPEKCFFVDQSGQCGSCWGCEDCVGIICDTCGFCEECQESEGGMHCPDCNSCFSDAGNCLEDNESNTHCAECCNLCEACETCYYDEGIYLCDFCGLCPDCCAEAASDLGCSCGEFCIESSEWFEHVCTDCGNAYCEIEQCEYCGFCLECCESASDCIDEMCVENPDYDYHFCEDCGDCFCINDLCESCEMAGELRCVDCCGTITSDLGCDCGDRCFNEDDFEEHLLLEHYSSSSSTHQPTAKSEWIMDATGHWHECRYCDEISHQKIGYDAHDLNKYGVCVVCGFDSYAKILILKQPKSRVVSLTNLDASWDDPQHPRNNKVQFVTAARGMGELTYQWYYGYGSNWEALEDHSEYRDDWYIAVEGAQTPTLEISVSADSCYNTLGYKCVITDEEDNAVETIVAYIRAPHDYSGECTPSYGEHYDTIAQYGPNIPIYHTDGHWVQCIGDGCYEERLVPHRFEKNPRILVNLGTNIYGEPMGDGSEWYEYTCKDCGGKKYEKKHEHYFVDPETGDCDIDYSYENASEHRLRCLFTHKGVRCTTTTLENHTFLNTQIMGSPNFNNDGIGISYKECRLCSYQDTRKPEIYDEQTDSMVPADWTMQNNLVEVEYGYANAELVKVGDRIRVTFSPTDYDKTEMIGINNPLCIAWEVYYVYQKKNGKIDEINVSQWFSFTKLARRPSWETTISNFAGYTGGGIFVFKPLVDANECTHANGTRREGAYAPICVKDGYTGNNVCVDCGYIVDYGEVIESCGYHTGTLTLNPLTVRQGTCDHRGYSGTSRCSVCKMSVSGSSTPKVHSGPFNLQGYVAPTCVSFGYSGDTYCQCGELIDEGKLLAPEHKNVVVIGYEAPSASSNGYSGDLKCTDCNIILKYGYTIPSDRIINHIEINDLVVPLPGETPSYTATMGSNKYSLDIGATSYTKNGIAWYCNYVPMHYRDRFKGGYTYRVRIVVMAQGANFFAGDVTASINGNPASVEFLSDSKYVVLEYTFDDLPRRVIDHIDITNVLEPVDGMEYSSNATLSHPTLYYVDEFTYIEDDENYMYSKFEKGKSYTLYMLLRAYWDQCTISENVTVTINGKTAEIVNVDPGEEGSVYIKYDFGLLEGPLAMGELYGKWKINPTLTGVYDISASGIARNEIAVFDKDGKEVKYYETKQGWPLVEGETYSVRLKYNGQKFTDPNFILTMKAQNMFPDTDAGGWYHKAVAYSLGTGILKGYSDGYFGTSDGIQRQDFLVMLARYDGVDLSQYANQHGNFGDVAENSYYEAAVNWGYQNGIVTGYQNGNFGVGDMITREQIVTFLYRYAKYKGMYMGVSSSTIDFINSQYTDAVNISEFSLDAVVWAIDRGIIKGKTETQIAPQGNAQRCEVAQIMYNIFLKKLFS